MTVQIELAIVFCDEGTSRKCEVKRRVFEVRLGQRRGSSYGMGGRGIRSLRSSNFSNLRTSRDWLQLGFIVQLLEIIVNFLMNTLNCCVNG